MLSNYVLCKRMETYFDRKMLEIQKETIYTIGRNVIPLIAFYSFWTTGWSTASHKEKITIVCLLLFLAILFLWCFKYLREFLINSPLGRRIREIVFYSGIISIFKPQNKTVDEFTALYPQILKDMALLRLILCNLDHASFDLFIHLAEKDIEFIKSKIVETNIVITNRQQILDTYPDLKIRLKCVAQIFLDLVSSIREKKDIILSASAFEYSNKIERYYSEIESIHQNL